MIADSIEAGLYPDNWKSHIGDIFARAGIQESATLLFDDLEAPGFLLRLNQMIVSIYGKAQSRSDAEASAKTEVNRIDDSIIIDK